MSLHTSATLAVLSAFLFIEACALALPCIALHAPRLPWLILLTRLCGPKRRKSAAEYVLGGYETRLIESIQGLSRNTEPRPLGVGDNLSPPLSHSALHSLHISRERPQPAED